MLKTTRFETTDREEAIAAFSALGGSRPTVEGRGDIPLSATVTTSDVVSDAILRLGAQIDAVNVPADLIHVVTPGSAHVLEYRGTQYAAMSGQAFRPPSHLGYRTVVPPGTAAVTALPGEVVRDVARTAFVAEPSELNLDAVQPVSPAMERLWRSTIALYRQYILQPDMYDQVLVRDEATRSLIATAVVAFGLHQPADTRASASAAARRARNFIDENLARPLTIHDIATAARLSVRGLQYAFSHAYGQTATAYLRSARLAAVRDDLMRSDPSDGDSVGAIAHRWGFVHLGRFAAAYREAFGETPRATLSRG